MEREDAWRDAWREGRGRYGRGGVGRRTMTMSNERETDGYTAEIGRVSGDGW
jgi:hypothetical protein